MTREPDPFAELDRLANEPIPLCDSCHGAEVSAKGDLCDACEAAAIEDEDADQRVNEEREATT